MKKAIPLLTQLKNSNFSVKMWYLTPTIQELIRCNLLFYDAEEALITVQNHILE